MAYCELCGNVSGNIFRCSICGRRVCPNCEDLEVAGMCFECVEPVGKGAANMDERYIDDNILDDDYVDDEDSLDEYEIGEMVRNGGGYIRPTGRY